MLQVVAKFLKLWVRFASLDEHAEHSQSIWLVHSHRWITILRVVMNNMKLSIKHFTIQSVFATLPWLVPPVGVHLQDLKTIIEGQVLSGQMIPYNHPQEVHH